MPHTDIWVLHGTGIESDPVLTLRAYLGDRGAIDRVSELHGGVLTADELEDDDSFDPDPHGLGLTRDACELSQFVHGLGLWGPNALVLVSISAAYLQGHQRLTQDARLASIRGEAVRAMESYFAAPGPESFGTVRRARETCETAYRPHEEEPDSPRAIDVWLGLGAPWFALETITQDFRIKPYDEPGPRQGSSTWLRRNAVWPTRAADAAALSSTYAATREALRQQVLDWILEGKLANVWVPGE